MRRTRRIRGLMDRKSLDDAYRSIHLRNIRINYSLNHEWEQLNWEIWVCVPQKSTDYPFIAMNPARRARAKIDDGARAKIDLRASRVARNRGRRFRIPKRFLFRADRTDRAHSSITRSMEILRKEFFFLVRQNGSFRFETLLVVLARMHLNIGIIT